MQKEKPKGWSIGMMSFASLGVILAAPAIGVAVPFFLKAVTCFGCAWSSNETLKKFTGRIPKSIEVKTPPLVQGWSIFVGYAAGGKRIYHNFFKLPHSKIAGITGSGKTAFLMYLIASLCMSKTPDELEVWIIDLKEGASFGWFEHFSHVRVFSNTAKAAEALKEALDETRKRLQQIDRARRTFQKLPWFKKLLIVVDEGAEMSPEMTPNPIEKNLRNECHDYLSSIVRLGREPSVLVMFGTQRPSNDSLPTHIRGQMDGTFCFRTENELDSEIALRHKGAEELPYNPGRCLYKYPGGEIQIQVPFASEETLTEWIKSGGKSDFVDIPFDMGDKYDSEVTPSSQLSPVDLSEEWDD